MNVEQSLMSRQWLREQIKCWGPCSCKARRPSAVDLPWDWPPAQHKGTKPSTDSFSSFQPTGAPLHHPHPHIRDSLIGHSLAWSTPAHSHVPTDRGSFWVRALFLWGPHPANLPVNSRLAAEPLKAHGPRGKARPQEPQGGPGRVPPRRGFGAIAWLREKHTHSCNRSINFLRRSHHK